MNSDLAILYTAILVAGTAGLLIGYFSGQVEFKHLRRPLVFSVLAIAGALAVIVLLAIVAVALEAAAGLVAGVAIWVAPVLFAAIVGPFLAAFALGRWMRARFQR